MVKERTSPASVGPFLPPALPSGVAGRQDLKDLAPRTGAIRAKAAARHITHNNYVLCDIICGDRLFHLTEGPRSHQLVSNHKEALFALYL